MNREAKTAIIVAILITLLWGSYITFIYLQAVPENMEKDCNAWNPNAAQTKSICLPKVYTSFGWFN